MSDTFVFSGFKGFRRQGGACRLRIDRHTKSSAHCRTEWYQWMIERSLFLVESFVEFHHFDGDFTHGHASHEVILGVDHENVHGDVFASRKGM